MGSSNSRFITILGFQKIDLSPPNNLQAKIGIYLYSPNEIEKKQCKKFAKHLSKDPSLKESIKGLQNKKFHKGLPQKYRWEHWKNIVSLVTSEEEYINLPIPNEFEHDISKDLNRTFPEHPYFNKSLLGYYGQHALSRILNKFASKHKEIGYCQGMNYIVGFLLMVSGGLEIEVYYFLESIYEIFKLQDFFTKEMKGLKHYLWIFDKIFESKLVKLYWHFKNEEIFEDMWVFKYFITLFTSNFPLNLTVYIWDLFLLNGFENIYKVLLSILKLNQEKLLKLSGIEILNFLNNLHSNSIVPQNLIVKALKTKVNKDKKENYEREYKSLPCPNEEYFERSSDVKECYSPKTTIQLVTEEPPCLVPKYKSVHSEYHLILNPFIVEDSLDLNEGSDFDQSFNAEDVLNELIAENDFDNLYIPNN